MVEAYGDLLREEMVCLPPVQARLWNPKLFVFLPVGYVDALSNSQGVHDLHVVCCDQFIVAVIRPSAIGNLLWTVEPVDTDIDVLRIKGADFKDAGNAVDMSVGVEGIEGLRQWLEARDDGVLVYGVGLISYWMKN